MFFTGNPDRLYFKICNLVKTAGRKKIGTPTTLFNDGVPIMQRHTITAEKIKDLKELLPILQKDINTT